jgi:hypothetical protein
MAKILFRFTDRSEDDGIISYRVDVLGRNDWKAAGAVVETALGWETIDRYGTPTGRLFPNRNDAGEYLVVLFSS